jgi:hypothetical protein
MVKNIFNLSISVIFSSKYSYALDSLIFMQGPKDNPKQNLPT